MASPVAPAIWQASFEQSPDPCFVYEVRPGAPRFRLVAVNAAWIEATGIPRAALGKSLAELMPPALASFIAARLEGCVAGRVPVSFDEELRFQDQPRYWRTRLVPLASDAGEEIDHIIGFGHDYTELRATSAALAESEAKFRRLVENAADVVYRLRIEPSVGFDYLSPSIEQVTGYAPQKFYDNPGLLRDLIHPEDLPKVTRTRETLKDDVGPVLARWGHRDGSYRWVEARSSSVIDASGCVVAREGIARDVTEQRRREHERSLLERRLEQTQKLESLGMLAGGIAHDFNNLLTGILGQVSLLLLERNTSQTVKEQAGHIELAAKRAAALCRQMLDYSGKGRFSLRRLLFDDLVRETAQLVQLSLAQRAELRLELVAARGVVEADLTQLQQVTMNLLLNASEACEPGRGVVKVRTGLAEVGRDELRQAYLSPDIPAGSYVFLDVIDNGIGMDPATLARIFDPFFTTKFTGRGLGLSAVLGIVRGHAGAIKVDSRPGEGTTFRVLLPLVDGPADSQPSPEVGRVAAAAGCVLVVDDEEVVRSVTARILEMLGYSTLTAANGQEGVEAFRVAEQPILAVLMDLTMPRLDGVAALAQLRKLDERVPVVLMSGYDEQDAVARFSQSGLAGFLQKPFTAEMLRSTLVNAIARSKLS